MYMQIVKFTSPLDKQEVHEKYVSRSDIFRKVDGLAQKYYMDWENGQSGAIYVWESKEKMEQYLAGKVASGVADAYNAGSTLEIQLGEVVHSLYE